MTDAKDISRGVAAMETGGARGLSPTADAKTVGGDAEQHAEKFFEFRDVSKAFDDHAVLKDEF
jgi:hypothetical protein